MNTALRFSASVALLTFWVLGACSGSECKNVWSSKAESSPDGKWFAEVHQYLCDGGLGPAEEKDVELRLASSPQTKVTVLSPSGQWTEPGEVKLHWVSSGILEISVPNRTMFGTQVPQYRDVVIKVRYENDDPADRTKWLEWVKKNKEWVNGGSNELQPMPPPLPSSAP
jgi:hypothetical protein